LAYFIEKRVGKRATTYRVQVTISSAGRIVHKESKSFPARRAADSWGAARDNELQDALELMVEGDPDEWNKLTGRANETTTLAEISKRYRTEYSASFGRTVGEDLKLLERSELFRLLPVAKVKASDIVAHVKLRVDGVKHPDRTTFKVAPVSPATAANDLVRLSTLFDAAWASFGIEVPREELEKARIECRKRRLIAKARERDRLVTDDEITTLCEHFEASSRGSIPMRDIVLFAVASARRQDEITQLRWVDCDAVALTGKVPRLKDPGGRRQNVTFKFTREAWDIAMRQPRDQDRIFPYESRSISSAFTRACKVLGIENLTFHDLRHRAVTDLFRAGYPVHEVAHFSLHRSWQTLKRYMNATPDQVVLR
jgi:integrase